MVPRNEVGGFEEPDWEAALDVVGMINATPADATVRGMFFMDFVRAAEKAGGTAGRGTYVAFNKYPMREYMEVAVEVACFAHPDDSLRRALRELGRVVYPNFVQTMIGSAIFVLAGKDFARVAKLAPKAYNVSIEPGLVTTVAKDEHHVEVQLRDVWSFPASLQVGIWEGALQACDVSGDIRVRSHSPCDVDLDIRWAG